MCRRHDPRTSEGVYARLRGRFRHGLVTQEILDRLAERRLVIYPYLVTLESGSDAEPQDPKDYTFRWLEATDAEQIAGIALRRTSAAAVRARMERVLCMGAFHGGRLAGYTWAGTHTVPVPGSGGHPLLRLGPDQVYLFDIFVAPEHRGARLAPALRAHLLRRLAEQGRHRACSLTLLFNRSSRRFKARLGAREVELRLYVHLQLGRLPGVDLRLWRRRPLLATRRGMLIPPPAGQAPRD